SRGSLACFGARAPAGDRQNPTFSRQPDRRGCEGQRHGARDGQRLRLRGIRGLADRGLERLSPAIDWPSLWKEETMRIAIRDLVAGGLLLAGLAAVPAFSVPQAKPEKPARPPRPTLPATPRCSARWPRFTRPSRVRRTSRPRRCSRTSRISRASPRA